MESEEPELVTPAAEVDTTEVDKEVMPVAETSDAVETTVQPTVEETPTDDKPSEPLEAKSEDVSKTDQTDPTEVIETTEVKDSTEATEAPQASEAPESTDVSEAPDASVTVCLLYTSPSPRDA